MLVMLELHDTPLCPSWEPRSNGFPVRVFTSSGVLMMDVESRDCKIHG